MLNSFVFFCLFFFFIRYSYNVLHFIGNDYNSARENIKCNVFVFAKSHIDRYFKNGASKSIVHVIKHANFQLYTVNPDGVI